MRGLYTIGHSTQSWEQFLELLTRHRIDAIGDVRSSPYSARFSHFNRDILDRALRAANIRYVFLGDELGARRSERDCYVDGVARYDRIARTAAFRAGLERVRAVAQRHGLQLHTCGCKNADLTNAKCQLTNLATIARARRQSSLQDSLW